MNKKTAFRAIDFYLYSFGNFEGKKIKIFGGESLLNIALLREIIAYIRKNDSIIKIDLTTNGTFLDLDLLSWLKEKKVDLSISIDGDFKNQIKNRKGITKKIYDKNLKFLQAFSDKITINVVAAPNNVDSLARNFLYLYKAGARKFKLLPAAYVVWPSDKIEIFKRQLNVLSFLIKKNKDIYLKNCEPTTSGLFFLNTGIVVDTGGDIFLTDAIILKKLQKIKNTLRIGNIEKIDSFDFIKRRNSQKDINDIADLISTSVNTKISESNEKISSLMDNFILKLKTKAANNKVVDIKIGYQCNNKCFFCAQGSKRKKCLFRKKEKIERELKEARKTISSVVFTGGEPTLHPYFLDFISFAKELNFNSIQIQTNGRMFSYDKFCLEAIKRGATEFSPSLHGHNASLHDYLTSAPGSFQQTVQGIKNLKALGQRVITNSVITSKNYKYLPAMAKLLVSLDVEQFQFAFIHIVGTAKENKNWLISKKSDIMPYVKRGIDIGRKAGKIVITEAIPYCLMKGYEDCVAEQIIPDAKVIEKNLTVENFTLYRQNVGKVKTQKCQKCVYFSVCEGPWKEYPELFGWSEFKPVLS